jgi:hypothetical protein
MAVLSVWKTIGEISNVPFAQEAKSTVVQFVEFYAENTTAYPRFTPSCHLCIKGMPSIRLRGEKQRLAPVFIK